MEAVEDTKELFEDWGLTLSEAFNLLLYEVRVKHTLPFEVSSYGHTPKPETIALIKSIENGTTKMLGPFSTFEDFKRSLYEEDDDDDDL